MSIMLLSLLSKAVVEKEFEMELARKTVVFEHGFDAATVEDIVTLRRVRLNFSEKLLSSLDWTMERLGAKGHTDENGRPFEQHAIAAELRERISTLRQRLENSDAIYADELELYAELMQSQKE